MEELSPAIALPFRVGNSLCDSPMDITRFKLITDTAGLLADPVAVPATAEQGEAVAMEEGGSGDDSDVRVVQGSDEEDSVGPASLLVDPVAVPAAPEQTNVVAMEEGGSGDDMEVRAVPGSDEEDSISVGPELSAGSSCSVISDTSSINSAADEFLNADSSYDTGTPTSMDVATGVEILAETAFRELDTSALTMSMVDSQIIGSQSVDPVIQESLASGSSTTGKSVFLMDYVPLWGSISKCGRRPEMEDAVAIVPHFYEIPLRFLIGNQVLDGLDPSLIRLPGHFFGVYDGHGGAQVANYCCERIHHALVERLNNSDKDFGGNSTDDRQQQWERVFVDCFRKVDDEVGGKVRRGNAGSTSDASESSNLDPDVPLEPVAPETVGSTAVVAVICSSHIIVANCGDSRAVLCRGKQPIPLSSDHKPNREDEYARIEAEGGKVIQWNGYRVFGVLAMSRSIGDRYLKPWIIPQPEVTIVPRTREDECLVLASDGLWDVMSNEEVCDVARRRILQWHKKNGVTPSVLHRGEEADPAAQAAADCLSKLALQKGSKDNITVIVVDLKAQRKLKTKT